MTQELVASAHVANFSRAIGIMEKLYAVFDSQFDRLTARFPSTSWLFDDCFSMSVEQDREVLVEIFAHVTAPRRGRPRQVASCGRTSRLPPKPFLSGDTWVRLTEVKSRIEELVNTQPLHISDAEYAEKPARLWLWGDDVFNNPSFADDPLACDEAIGWLFEKFDNVNKVGASDTDVFRAAHNVREALLNVRNERRPQSLRLHSVVPTPTQEIKRFRGELIVLPLRRVSVELVEQLSPYARYLLDVEMGGVIWCFSAGLYVQTDSGVPMSEWRVVGVGELARACDRILQKQNGAPKKIAAYEAVRTLKSHWRRLAGPHANCITYPKRSAITCLEICEPHGDCLELVREIANKFGLILPIEPLT